MRSDNYCRKNGMSICTAGVNDTEQGKCWFFKKNSRLSQCRFYRPELGNHCDCIAAHKDRDEGSGVPVAVPVSFPGVS